MLYYNVISYKSVITTKYNISRDRTQKSLMDYLKASHSIHWRSASISLLLAARIFVARWYDDNVLAGPETAQMWS